MTASSVPTGTVWNLWQAAHWLATGENPASLGQVAQASYLGRWGTTRDNDLVERIRGFVSGRTAPTPDDESLLARICERERIAVGEWELLASLIETDIRETDKRKEARRIAVDTLQRSARAGTITLYERHGGAWKAIPRERFFDQVNIGLEPQGWPCEGWMVHADELAHYLRAADTTTDAATSAKLSIGAETQACAWLEAEMKAWKAIPAAVQPGPPRNSDLRERAQRSFPGLSERAFKRAKVNAQKAAGVEWDQSGRRKSTH